MPAKQKLPKFEDWTPPWEVKGEDFDEASAARYIYNLTSDKERLQESVATAKQATTDVQEELEQAKTALNEAQASNSTDESAVRTLQTKVTELEGRATKAEATALRYEVALEAGLPAVHVPRLVGSTKEELEQDAGVLAETLGLKPGGGSETDDDDDEVDLRRGPRTDLTNPLTGGSGEQGKEVDYDAVVASFNPRVG